MVPYVAVETVLSHKHDKLSKNIVLVRCVDLKLAEEPGYSIVPVIDDSKEIISHKPFFVNVAQHYMTCLKFYRQNIDDQLKTLHASMQLDEGKTELQIFPCTGSESIEDWQLHCNTVVDTFMGTLTVETLSFSNDKADIMHPVINKLVQQEKALHIKCVKDSVTIAGEKSDVQRVKEELTGAYQTIVSESILIRDEKFFILLSAKLKYKTPNDPSEVQASINPDDCSVTITGFEDKCEEFKTDLHQQMDHMRCVPVLLNDLFIQFLCTESGKVLLKYYVQYFRSEVVAHLDNAGSLFILGTAESQVTINKLIQVIQTGLRRFQIGCPPSIEKFCQGKEWLDFCANLELKQFVQIKIAKHRIRIIGDVRLSSPVKEQIEKFFDSECRPTKQFKLCNAQWRVIQTYMNKKWRRLEKELHRERKLQVVVPDMHDEDPIIIVEGERSKVDGAGEKIEQFLSLIVTSTPIKQIRYGIVKYFFSEKGKIAVKDIEDKEHSCIQIAIEDDSVNQSTMSGPPVKVGETSLASSTVVRQRGLCIQVYAIDNERVRKTDTCLQQLIKSRLFKDKIDDRIISQITPKQHSIIEQKAKARNVDITIEAGKMQHYIQLEGDLSSIITLKHEIHSTLHEPAITETMQRDIKSTQTKVKWQWQSVSGAYEDYDAVANYDIEQAYQADQNALYDMHDSTEQFNFLKMEVKNKRDKTVYKIKRSKVRFGKFYIRTQFCLRVCITTLLYCNVRWKATCIYTVLQN